MNGRPLPPPPPAQAVRLSKRMAELGMCSRREADDWIARGWVRVDGQPATLGVRVRADQRIEVTRDAVQASAELVTVLVHKPVGFVSGQAEHGYRHAIELIVEANRDRADAGPALRPEQRRGLVAAGRLDIDSSGLLVLTQDGRVARRLVGADHAVDKEYLVRVEGPVDAGVIARLRHGLAIDGVPLLPVEVERQNPDQLRFVLREGRKRQIRKMCALVGLTVVGLKRVRIGDVRLGGLAVGRWRRLRADESF